MNYKSELEFDLELQYWLDYYTYKVGQQEVKIILKEVKQ